MTTVHAEPPLAQRVAFLHLPPDERLRQKFRNLRRLQCCPVCAREAIPGPFCDRHREAMALAEQERRERLARERRCELCETSFHRSKRDQAGAKCIRCAIQTPEQFYGLPVCLPVYEQLLRHHEFYG